MSTDPTEFIFTGATTPHTSKTNPIPSKQSRPTCAKHRKRACHFDPDTVKYLLRGDVAQLVRALRSHRRGRGFEPLHPHQKQRVHHQMGSLFLRSCLGREAAYRIHRSVGVFSGRESPYIRTKRKPPIRWFLFGLRSINLKLLSWRIGQ